MELYTKFTRWNDACVLYLYKSKTQHSRGISKTNKRGTSSAIRTPTSHALSKLCCLSQDKEELDDSLKPIVDKLSPDLTYFRFILSEFVGKVNSICSSSQEVAHAPGPSSNNFLLDLPFSALHEAILFL